MQKKVIETATPLLEPGETILAAVSVIKGSNKLMRFRLAAMLMSRFRVVAVSGANVYILAADALTGTRAKKVEQRYPLGSVEVRFVVGIAVVAQRPPILGLVMPELPQPPGRLHVGGQRFWVRARDTNDAWAVTGAATL